MPINFSEYQTDIFDFIKHGYGNAVVQAVPGAGKSFTIIKALDYIKKDKQVLFLAFNDSIVQELSLKIDRHKTDVKTLHSLGFSILKSNFKDLEITIDENKYKKILKTYFDENGISNEIKLKKQKKYINNILKLCDFGRLYLATNTHSLLELSEKYDMQLLFDEIDITLNILSLAKNQFNENGIIDFTDMLYLPNVLTVKTYKYDFIIIDEAQDLSIAQMKLFNKCFKQGGRFIAVGDENQCIYSFAGSSTDSFDKLKKLPNTIELPLSICYRCPSKVIDFVKKFNPSIEKNPNAIEGKIKYDETIEDIQDSDMVLCRNTAPLIGLHVKLLNLGKKSFIKGKDVGLSILNLIEDIEFEELNQDLSEQGLFSELINNSKSYVNHLKEKLGVSLEEVFETQMFSNLCDKIETLEILSQNIETKTELIEKIIEIFSDENKNGICLSTVHKAKGLETNNVFILNNYLMPSKYVKTEWEKQQEMNIQYVAYTRPKEKLSFIYSKSENEIEESQITKELKMQCQYH